MLVTKMRDIHRVIYETNCTHAIVLYLAEKNTKHIQLVLANCEDICNIYTRTVKLFPFTSDSDLQRKMTAIR